MRIIPGAAAAPLQRPDLHRPEGTECLRARRFATRSPCNSSLFHAFNPPPEGPLELDPPAPERVRAEPVALAIFALTHSAPMPRGDVNRPQRSPRLVRKPRPFRHPARPPPDRGRSKLGRETRGEQTCRIQTLSGGMAEGKIKGVAPTGRRIAAKLLSAHRNCLRMGRSPCARRSLIALSCLRFSCARTLKFARMRTPTSQDFSTLLAPSGPLRAGFADCLRPES